MFVLAVWMNRLSTARAGVSLRALGAAAQHGKAESEHEQENRRSDAEGRIGAQHPCERGTAPPPAECPSIQDY